MGVYVGAKPCYRKRGPCTTLFCLRTSPSKRCILFALLQWHFIVLLYIVLHVLYLLLFTCLQRKFKLQVLLCFSFLFLNSQAIPSLPQCILCYKILLLLLLLLCYFSIISIYFIILFFSSISIESY